MTVCHIIDRQRRQRVYYSRALSVVVFLHVVSVVFCLSIAQTVIYISV